MAGLFAEGPAQSCRMVGLGGLEPPTSPLSGARSNHLSYRPGRKPTNCDAPDGGASRDRTDDPLLAKQVLSQLSYGPVFRDDKTALSLCSGAVSVLSWIAGVLCGRLADDAANLERR